VYGWTSGASVSVPQFAYRPVLDPGLAVRDGPRGFLVDEGRVVAPAAVVRGVAGDDQVAASGDAAYEEHGEDGKNDQRHRQHPGLIAIHPPDT
jgi:hypothetical protein